MELKTARLTLLIDPAKKNAFERLCARQDLTPSQVVRQLIRDYLTQHGVSYVPSGARAGGEAGRALRGAAPAAGPAKARKRG
ncbi:MAG: CopG family transcriptional regulator [Caldimonas sp.]